MATSTPVFVPLEEYLRTTYRPDRDWIDGETKERNLGEKPHARIQGFFIRFLGNREEEWNILVYPEQRVQTSAHRARRRSRPSHRSHSAAALHRSALEGRHSQRNPRPRPRLHRHGRRPGLGRRPSPPPRLHGPRARLRAARLRRTHRPRHTHPGPHRRHLRRPRPLHPPRVAAAEEFSGSRDGASLFLGAFSRSLSKMPFCLRVRVHPCRSCCLCSAALAAEGRSPLHGPSFREFLGAAVEIWANVKNPASVCKTAQNSAAALATLEARVPK